MNKAILLWICLSLAGAVAQNTKSGSVWKHQFSDYEVAKVYKGKPAPVILTRSNRRWRTRLREGAEDGPNFAGHYTIAIWGCGSSCSSVAIIDAATGQVQFPGLNPVGIPFQKSRSGREYEGLVYRLDSSLLIVDGCPREEDSNPPPCGTYYYLMKDATLKQFDSAVDPPAD
jgi:hypothetical protein